MTFVSPNLVNYIASIDNPHRYYIILKVDISHKIDIDLFPLGKGYTIWAFLKTSNLLNLANHYDKPPVESKG